MSSLHCSFSFSLSKLSNLLRRSDKTVEQLAKSSCPVVTDLLRSSHRIVPQVFVNVAREQVAYVLRANLRIVEVRY